MYIRIYSIICCLFIHVHTYLYKCYAHTVTCHMYIQYMKQSQLHTFTNRSMSTVCTHIHTHMHVHMDTHNQEHTHENNNSHKCQLNPLPLTHTPLLREKPRHQRQSSRH